LDLLSALGYCVLGLVAIEVTYFVANQIVSALSNIPNPYLIDEEE